jgi:hypothetical protein
VANYGLVGATLPSADDVANVVGAPVDATAWALRKAGVSVPQDPALGSQNVRHVLRKYSDFYGPNGPVQVGFRNLTAPPEPPPQLRAPAPEAPQPTPGFDQSTAKRRDDLIGPAALTLGAPVDGATLLLSMMGVPTNWKQTPDGQRVPNVPLGALWWQNAINNPSLTWDQVRGALQAPSIHSLRGLGGLF